MLIAVLVLGLLVLTAVVWWRDAWRQAKVDADPEMLHWLLVSTAAPWERRSGADRRAPWRSEAGRRAS